MNKKGFMFVVAIFLVLTYILLSISVWVKSIESSERFYSEFYRESNVELAAAQITPAKVGQVADITLNRGLFLLNEHSINHPVRPADAGSSDEFAYARRALFSLLVNGTASPNYFEDSVGIPLDASSSLNAWISGFNSSLKSTGAYISDYSVKNFDLVQNTYDTVNYSFDIKLKISDYANSSSTSKDYKIKGALNITGLVDPALVRESQAHGRPMFRQFYFNSGSSSRAVTLARAPSAGGAGWFYGPLAIASSSPSGNMPAAISIAPADRPLYVLVGRFEDILSIPGYEEFGAYLLTAAPSPSTSTPSTCSTVGEANTFMPVSYRTSACTAYFDYSAGRSTRNPFIVSVGFNPTDSRYDCPSPTGGSIGKCALILSAYSTDELRDDPTRKFVNITRSGPGVYGIERIRDFTLCGDYSNSPLAPSYLQRLFSDSYSRRSPFGLETFVIGQYVNPTVYAGRSHLDREIFNSTITGIKVRGMPGCRTPGACSSTDLSTGIFTLSSSAISAYGLGDISCEGNARC
ncbi:hypothetical protein HY990_06485 [Candidatus Micrarchaeota archaeon]|nr:hypothetical protein [Candidatus Micrarchaeota archaeon]